MKEEKLRIEMEKSIKDIELKALHYQINPHFINNTLGSINMYAISLLGKKNDISEMVRALSTMLRISLENTDTIISLKDELKHAELYLSIEMRRFPDKFDVIWNMGEDIMECKIVKIVLQPLIENAIYHGIKNLTDKGTIVIEGKKLDELLLISVSDDGLGMQKEEVQRLNDAFRNEAIKESRHIGLVNVNQRLGLYFGDEYGVKVYSEEMVGTKVTIKIPYIK